MNKLFVLIQGSWHGGWAWDEVVRRLSKGGHLAHAPTLPGHGPGEIRAGITHEKFVDAVVTYIQRHRLEQVTLVGHSFGGTVVQKVAERLPDRIARTVFLAALILADNQSVFDNLPADYVATFRALAAGSSDNTVMIPWEIWRDNFIQDAPEKMARALWKRLSPEPNQVNLEKLDLKRFYSLDLPKSVIFCRHDKALPQGYFHPRMSSRLGVYKLLEMDGSHEVMFTRPQELADKIVQASSD